MSDAEGSPEVAIVVGVGPSAGLGGALCRRFARQGLTTIVAGRTAASIEAVAAEIGRTGGTAVPVVTDATDGAAVTALFEEAASHGRPSIVVYNAGNNRRRAMLEIDAVFLEQAWRVGCLGGFLVGREAASRMLAAGRGTIIFTGATASIKARPPFTAFAAAKFALRAIAQAMAREFGPKGLHVGHVIIDGGIAGEKILANFPQMVEQRGREGLLDIDAIADAYWALHQQHPTAWSHEIDLRPFKETF